MCLMAYDMSFVFICERNNALIWEIWRDVLRVTLGIGHLVHDCIYIAGTGRVIRISVQERVTESYIDHKAYLKQ